MGISNRLNFVKAWLGLLCIGSAVFCCSCAKTTILQTIHRSTTVIMVAVPAMADIMGMGKAEWSISRILTVRHRRCPENNNYAFESDELPGTRCHPAARFSLVRFYGLKPLRSGLGGASIVSSVKSPLSLTERAAARRR